MGTCKPRILIQCCLKMNPSSSGCNFSFQISCNGESRLHSFSSMTVVKHLLLKRETYSAGGMAKDSFVDFVQHDHWIPRTNKFELVLLSLKFSKRLSFQFSHI